MITDELHPQFLLDANGERSLVVLSRTEYEQILSILEDVQDVRLSRERLAAEGDQSLSFESVRAEMEADG